MIFRTTSWQAQSDALTRLARKGTQEARTAAAKAGATQEQIARVLRLVESPQKGSQDARNRKKI